MTWYCLFSEHEEQYIARELPACEKTALVIVTSETVKAILCKPWWESILSRVDIYRRAAAWFIKRKICIVSHKCPLRSAGGVVTELIRRGRNEKLKHEAAIIMPVNYIYCSDNRKQKSPFDVKQRLDAIYWLPDKLSRRWHVGMRELHQGAAS